MKVYLGKYKNPAHSYGILMKLMPNAELETLDKIDKWIPKWPFKLWNQIFFLEERKVRVRIDPWDTWSMDHSLALIVLPMLKQLKNDKHGSPNVDDKDVPKHLRSTAAPKKENEWDTDALHHDRWDWVLDEMIWAFEQKVDPEEGMGHYYDPYKSYEEAKNDKFMINEQQEDGTIVEKELFPEHGAEYRIQRGKFNKDKYKKWQKRKENGFALFGKYFEALWD